MIRKMKEEDRDVFLKLTKMFYESDAVLHPIPIKHHIDTFNEIVSSDIYLEGYLFEVDEEPVGYALTSKTYSHEAGGIALWVEELFLLDEYCSQGIGRRFFEYLKTKLGTSIVRLRLEVESDNEGAIRFYKRMGLDKLSYEQMVIDKPYELS